MVINLIKFKIALIKSPPLNRASRVAKHNNCLNKDKPTQTANSHAVCIIQTPQKIIQCTPHTLLLQQEI